MGALVYGYWWEPGDPGTATDVDLAAIRQARDGLERDLAENSPKEMEAPRSSIRPLFPRRGSICSPAMTRTEVRAGGDI